MPDKEIVSGSSDAISSAVLIQTSDPVVDALKELTKAVAEMSKQLKLLRDEQEKLRKSGRF